jgi:hypothetical protein
VPSFSECGHLQTRPSYFLTLYKTSNISVKRRDILGNQYCSHAAMTILECVNMRQFQRDFECLERVGVTRGPV